MNDTITKLLADFDLAAQTHGWASDTGTVHQAEIALADYQRKKAALLQAVENQAAEIGRLRLALGTIGSYPLLRGQEMSAESMRQIARAALSGEPNG